MRGALRLPEAALLRLVIILAAALIAGWWRRGTHLEGEEETRTTVVPAIVVGNKHVGRSWLPRDEATLWLVVQDHDEFGAIVGLLAQRLVRDHDRGSRLRGRCDAIEHILRDGDAVKRIPG